MRGIYRLLQLLSNPDDIAGTLVPVPAAAAAASDDIAVNRRDGGRGGGPAVADVRLDKTCPACSHSSCCCRR